MGLDSLLTEIVGGARRLTGAIVLSLVTIYTTGFLVVNVHLGQFGIVRLELLRPRFIAVGVLFVFVALVAGLFALFLFVPVSEFLDLARWISWSKTIKQYLGHPSRPTGQVVGVSTDKRDEHKEQRLAKLLKKWFGSIEDIRPGGRWEQGGLVAAARARKQRRLIWDLSAAMVGMFMGLAVGIFLVLFPILESVASLVIAYLLTWAKTGEGIPLATVLVELYSKLEPVTQLQGIGAFFAFLLYDQIEYVHRVIKRGMIILIIVTCLAIQAYSLFWFASRLYSELPVSVGGGRPVPIQFVASSTHLQYLEKLGIPLDEYTGDGDVGKTDIVYLLDQTVSDRSFSTYVVLPCMPGHGCQAIEFDKTLVRGILYDPRKPVE